MVSSGVSRMTVGSSAHATSGGWLPETVKPLRGVLVHEPLVQVLLERLEGQHRGGVDLVGVLGRDERLAVIAVAALLVPGKRLEELLVQAAERALGRTVLMLVERLRGVDDHPEHQRPLGHGLGEVLHSVVEDQLHGQSTDGQRAVRGLVLARHCCGGQQVADGVLVRDGPRRRRRRAASRWRCRGRWRREAG